MIKFPRVSHLLKIDLRRFGKIKFAVFKITSLLLTHKILIMVLIFLSLVAGALIGIRNHFISQINIAQLNNSSPPPLNYSPEPEITEEASDSGSVSDDDSSVLGTSTRVETYIPIYYPSLTPDPTYTPTPQPTPTPAPTSTPTSIPVSINSTSTPSISTSTSSSSSAKNCSNLGTSPGVATAWYSQASTPQEVNDTTTINIELRDCNNNIAPVVDTLTISQSSGPASTVNGNSPPISIETRNGKASFTVKSQTSGTAVYIVRNTTKSFNVTDPNNKHPKVTFNISTPVPSATPAPSTAPSPSPSPIASTLSTSPTSSQSPVPTSSPVSSPSQTSSATPTPSSLEN